MTEDWACAPPEIANDYINKCRLFGTDDEAFKNFRQDPQYKKILEGGEYFVGKVHLDHLVKLNGIDFVLSNLDKFRENDLYGNPTICTYDYIGEICPCTLLYVSNAFDVYTLLGDYKPKKIVEIGGGYGGFCKTLSVLYDFEEYILIDLPEAILLAKKYLSKFPELKGKITFITTEEFKQMKSIKDVDLFIAVASMAECSVDVQRSYVSKVLTHSRFVYMVYNTLHIPWAKDFMNSMLDGLVSSFDISVIPETEVNFITMRKNVRNQQVQ